MTIDDKSGYDIIFHQVTHKGGESAMNYIKIFQNSQGPSVSLRNTYSEDQIMHTFLNHSYQGGKYSDTIYSHQAELRREGKCTDQTSLSISALQTKYLNIYSSSGCGKINEGENLAQTE